MDDDARAIELPLILESADATGRRFAGLASTPDPDVHGQTIDPLGVSFTNPAPLLMYHDQRIPVGMVTFGTPTAQGVPFTAEIPQVTEDGDIKAATDRAAHLVKYRLIRKVSAGLRPLLIDPLKDGVVRIAKSVFYELSLVTVPANGRAEITVVKSADLAPKERPAMTQTTAERITALEHSRAAKVGRLKALMDSANEANLTIDGGEYQAEYDGLELEVKKYDADLVRLRTLEELNIKAATPPVVSTGSALVRPNYSGAVAVKANVPPATAWTRMVQAYAACKGDPHSAAVYAHRWHDSTPEVELFIKAAVAAGTTTDATWAGPLAPFKPMQDEFLEYLRPATIVGKIPNLRRAPFLTSVPSQTGGAAAQWVGEGAPKPVGALQFGTVTLGLTKCAIIVVITDELAKNSSPSAEEIIRNDLINAIAYLIDTEFTLPARAPVANVAPGSITNGVTPITSAGTSPSNGRTDIAAMISALVAAGLSAAQAVLLMSESNAAALSAALNPLGQSLFAGLNITGGSALGIPVITSQAVASNVIMLHPPSILFADEGGVAIDISREASLQMDSAPMNPPDATVVMTSLWQSNRVGIRAERTINWKKARAGCVQYTVQTYVP
jgi:HK97 family phage major capsid protein